MGKWKLVSGITVAVLFIVVLCVALVRCSTSTDTGAVDVSGIEVTEVEAPTVDQEGVTTPEHVTTDTAGNPLVYPDSTDYRVKLDGIPTEVLTMMDGDTDAAAQALGKWAALNVLIDYTTATFYGYVTADYTQQVFEFVFQFDDRASTCATLVYDRETATFTVEE